jgi:hypothetical protein
VCVGIRCAIDDDLRDAVAIAQVEEDELAVVAPAVHPAGEACFTFRIDRAQLAAGVRAIGRRKVGGCGGHRGYRTVALQVSRGGGNRRPA